MKTLVAVLTVLFVAVLVGDAAAQCSCGKKGSAASTGAPLAKNSGGSYNTATAQQVAMQQKAWGQAYAQHAYVQQQKMVRDQLRQQRPQLLAQREAEKAAQAARRQEQVAKRQSTLQKPVTDKTSVQALLQTARELDDR